MDPTTDLGGVDVAVGDADGKEDDLLPLCDEFVALAQLADDAFRDRRPACGDADVDAVAADADADAAVLEGRSWQYLRQEVGKLPPHAARAGAPGGGDASVVDTASLTVPESGDSDSCVPGDGGIGVTPLTLARTRAQDASSPVDVAVNTSAAAPRDVFAAEWTDDDFADAADMLARGADGSSEHKDAEGKECEE
jgi:hypothetical protein